MSPVLADDSVLLSLPFGGAVLQKVLDGCMCMCVRACVRVYVCIRVCVRDVYVMCTCT